MGQMVSDVTEVLDYKKAKKEAKSARKEILKQMAADEAAKTNLVKKNLATQRAKYGASGMVGAGKNVGMTEEAVLNRIREETEEPYNEKARTNQSKLKKIKVTKPNYLKTLISRLEDLAG